MKKLLLIVPSLHQGGLEKVCAATARLMQPYFDVQIAIFDSRNIAYDIKGIQVADLRLPSRPDKIGKIINVLKRGFRLRRLKKDEHIDIAYSFWTDGKSGEYRILRQSGEMARYQKLYGYGKSEADTTFC